ncbi:MAG: hypothetical protein C4531_13945 [Desulfurivibrio sp.]|jgi:hypothetical protein|nr:MAG: hypothetical protein C4531_13945 [Desulfurivibrio sp.]
MTVLPLCGGTRLNRQTVRLTEKTEHTPRDCLQSNPLTLEDFSEYARDTAASGVWDQVRVA